MLRPGIGLEPVAVTELLEASRLDFGDAAEIDQLIEELLKACRGDDIQDPGWFVAGVPEGVPLPAGFEDQIAGLADHNLFAEQRSDLAPILGIGGAEAINQHFVFDSNAIAVGCERSEKRCDYGQQITGCQRNAVKAEKRSEVTGMADPPIRSASFNCVLPLHQQRSGIAIA